MVGCATVWLVGFAQESEVPESTITEFDALIEKVDKEIYNQPDLALEYAKAALKIGETTKDDFQIASGLNRIGAAYTSLGDLHQGLVYFEKSLDLAKTRGFESLIARNTGNIGVVYYHSGDSIGAIQNYEKALESYRLLVEKVRVFAMLNNIAKAYMDDGQFSKSRTYFEEAQSMPDVGFGAIMPVFLLNFAKLHYHEGNLEDCLAMLETCEAVSEKYHDIRALCKIKQLRADVSLDRGEVSKALEFGERAYQIAESSKLMDLLDETTLHLLGFITRTEKKIWHMNFWIAQGRSEENCRAVSSEISSI